MAATLTDETKSTAAVKQFRYLMLSVILLLVIGFAVIQLLDNRDEAPQLALTNYTSEDLGFSIDHPEGWLATETNDQFIRVASFDEPTDVDDESDPYRNLPAQILVDIQEAATPEAEFDEDTFFELIETNVEANLGRNEEAPGDMGVEYAELIAKEEIQVDGYRAVRVTVDIFNFESTPGENGRGVLTFIYVSPAKQVTLLYEGHSSDNAIYDDFHAIIDSFDLADNN